MSNNEILEKNLKLIKECLAYQFLKQDKTYKEDFAQDLYLIILTYDNDKLNKIYKEGHFNAWITGVIRNNILSRNSRYYKDYIKYDINSSEITSKELNITEE